LITQRIRIFPSFPAIPAGFPRALPAILAGLLCLTSGPGGAKAQENLLADGSEAISSEQPAQLVRTDGAATQESTSQQELTLKDALTAAMSDNTNLQLAMQAVELTRAGGRSAMASFNPDLSMMYSYTRLGGVQKISVPDVGDFSMGSLDTYRLGLTFKYSLYNGGQDVATRQASEAQVEGARLKVDQAKMLIEVGVTTAYTMVLEAREALDAKRASLDHINEMLRVAQANYDAGYLPQSDLLSVQVAKAQAEQAVAEMERNLELAQSGLAIAVGADITTRWKLAPVQYPESDIPFSQETLWDWALGQRPELKEIKTQRDAIEAQMDAIRSARKPRVNFQADYSNSGSKPTLGGSTGFGGGTSLSGTVGIFWDLWDSGRTDDILAPLQEQMGLLDLQEASLRDQIKQEVESALLNVRTQLGNLTVMRGAVSQAEEAYRVAQRRQQEGLGITLEVLNAESTLAQTSAGLTHMTYEYYRALSVLAQSVGLTTDDLVALIVAAKEGEK